MGVHVSRWAAEPRYPFGRAPFRLRALSIARESHYGLAFDLLQDHRTALPVSLARFWRAVGNLPPSQAYRRATSSSAMSRRTESALTRQIESIGADAGARRVAVAVYDYEVGRRYDYSGDTWFHAASTIKVPALVGVFAAIDAGALSLDSRVHVRNRFLSVADGTAFRVERTRDAAGDVHALIGKTMRVRELARHMIVTSSNLATNLLVDLVGVEFLQETIERLVPEGIELHRGVEDEAAFAADINNRVTANGLVRILRAIEENCLSRESSRQMLDILHEQEFRGGIPAGLPDTARVANKTGEISTMAHDAGLVYLPERQPYAVAILTEWDPSATAGRRDALAALSRAVYQHLVSDSG